MKTSEQLETNFCSKKNTKNVDVNIIVGRYLNKTRKCSGMTGEEIGNLLGISQQQISRYERGKSRICMKYIFDYMNLLGLSLFDLAYYIDKELNQSDLSKECFFINHKT